MTWYKDEALWQTFYDCMFDEASFQLAEEQIPQVLSLVDHEVKSVLDLGCGPGRHTLGLAKKAFKVTGIDTSDYLLSIAKQKNQKYKLNTTYIKADMLNFSSSQKFDLIINMFNSFGYLETQSKNQKVIDQAYANLAETGTLIIDTVGKETLSRNIEPVHLSEYENGDLRIERPLMIDNMQVFSNEWILIKGNKVFRRKYQHFVYTPIELTAMCKKAGFNYVETYGSLQGDDYDLESDRLVIVAKKLPKV